MFVVVNFVILSIFIKSIEGNRDALYLVTIQSLQMCFVTIPNEEFPQPLYEINKECMEY